MAHRICLKFIFKVHTEDIMNQMRRQFLKNGYIWMTHDTPMTQWISNTINALLGVMLPSEAAFSRGNGRTLVVCYGCQHRGVFPLLTATAFKLCAQCSGMEKRLNNKVTNSFIIHTLLPVRANKHTKIPQATGVWICVLVCVCVASLCPQCDDEDDHEPWPKDCKGRNYHHYHGAQTTSFVSICHWFPQQHKTLTYTKLDRTNLQGSALCLW